MHLSSLELGGERVPDWGDSCAYCVIEAQVCNVLCRFAVTAFPFMAPGPTEMEALAMKEVLI